jgi:tRNA U38,U39,U40 pseudouridine synthase TruA
MLYARAKTISIPKFQMKAATSKYGKRYRDRRYKDTSLLFDETAFHRATRTEKEEEEEEEPLECIAIELVADRFLRKMVRCIVSTACREASSSLSSSKKFNEDALLDLARNRDRMASAPPAPPHGLLFCGVGYGNKSYESFVTDFV